VYHPNRNSIRRVAAGGQPGPPLVLAAKDFAERDNEALRGVYQHATAAKGFPFGSEVQGGLEQPAGELWIVGREFGLRGED
jgi:hypothetical protein